MTKILDLFASISVKQAIIAIAIAIPAATTIWNATDWIVRPLLAQGIVEVLKDEGINLKEQSKKIDDTARSAAESATALKALKEETAQQTIILQEIQNAISNNAAAPQQ